MTDIRVSLKKSLGPFWRWTINLGVGNCEVGCVYCYNRRWEWADKKWVSKTDLSLFRKQVSKFVWEPGECKQYSGNWDIMMSSTGDPFSDSNIRTATEVLRLVSRADVGRHLRVLSKVYNEFGAEVLENSVPQDALYGVTITTLNNEIEQILQPGASSHSELVKMIGKMMESGLKTWISSEPMFVGMNLYELASYIEDTYGSLPTEWWVGRLNIRGDTPTIARTFRMDDRKIVQKFSYARDSFPDIAWFLKKEVVG